MVTTLNTNGTETVTVTHYSGLNAGTSSGGFSMMRSGAHTMLSMDDDSLSSCYAPGSGLIDWWQGETNAIDSVGSNNGTPVNGAGLDSGIVGSAFTFDGEDQAIALPYTNSLAISNFTFEAWVYPQDQVDNADGQAFIFGQAYGRQLVLNPGDDGITVAFYIIDQYGGWAGLGGGGQIPIADWTHLAVTWDGITMSLYTNGILAAAGEPGIDLIGDSTCDFSIAGVPGSCGYYGQYFYGLVDEASLYNRALLDCEINAIYSAGSAGKCKTPQPCSVLPNVTTGLWEGEGDALDLFESNDGFLQNGATFSSGVVSQAFSFSGASTAVEIPYDPSLATTNFSLEAWIYPTAQYDNPEVQAFIFGQSFGRQIAVRGGSTGLAVAFMVSADPDTFPEVDSTGEIPIGEWTHLVGTWDGTNLSLYVNGALDSQATPGIVPWDSGCAFHIGGIYDPSGDCAYSGQNFRGSIDESTLYQGALTADQVRAAYNAGASGKCYDSDSDGMPDWWEIKYFGNLSKNPNDDYDGDGVSNYVEYLEGRNPTVGVVADSGGDLGFQVFTPLQ